MPFGSKKSHKHKDVHTQEIPALKQKNEEEKTAQMAPPTEEADAKRPKSGKKKTRAKVAKRQKPDKLFGASATAFLRERTSIFGELFYNLGFYAEYYVLRAGRVARDAGMFVLQILAWMFGGTLGKIGEFFKGLLLDSFSPFRRKEKRSYEEEEEEEPKAASKRRRRGAAHSAATVFGGIGRLLMPIAACVALIYTIQTMFSWNYALAVEVNGEIIGYVEDESVLEDAQNILRMKMQLAPNQSLSEWDFTPTLTIGTSTEVANKTQIADGILRASSSEIMEATGIYVDNVLVGVTTEGDELRALLNDMLQKYEDPEHPEAVVDFVREVEVSEDGGVFFTESVQPYNELAEQLSRIERSEVRHTVVEGETLEDIAYEGGITLDVLRMRNPEYADAADWYRPDAGTSLLLEPEKPYLQVQTAFRRSVVESVPYDSVQQETGSLVYGTRRVTTPGAEGEQIVYYDEVYIDGEAVQQIRLDELTEVIREPVAEVVMVGTFHVGDTPVGIGGYSPVYMWPVPDATYSSRGFLGSAHRGLDINAPTGMPIYSSNAGTVVFAGWHWSYGWCVEIEHEDGLHTLYAHCSELYVQTGDMLDQFALIAAVGSTGVSTGPHCHFEVQIDGAPVDPYGFVTAPW